MPDLLTILTLLLCINVTLMLNWKIYEILPHGGQTHKAHTSPVHFVKQVQNDRVFYIQS